MLKSALTQPHLWNHTGKFIILTNLVALFYGLTSGFGLAYILAAYLIESVCIGIFTIVFLLKNMLLTRRFVAGVATTTLFTSAYFSWLLLFAVLPMLLMGLTPAEHMESFVNTFSIVIDDIGPNTPNLLLAWSVIIAAYTSSIVSYFLHYHGIIMITLAIIYCYEFIQKRPSTEQLEERSFASLLLQPFWRLMFLIHGPYFIGFAIYTNQIVDSGPEPISWEMNAALVIIITFIKTLLDLRRHRRALSRSIPVLYADNAPRTDRPTTTQKLE